MLEGRGDRKTSRIPFRQSDLISTLYNSASRQQEGEAADEDAAAA